MSVESALRVRHVPAARGLRGHVPAARPRAARGRFTDDRKLIRLKLMILGLLFAAVMALEVPW